MKKTPSFIVAHKLASAGFAVALLAGSGFAFWYVASNKAPSLAMTAVTRGDVTETVIENGTVEAEKSAQLSFEEGGQIVSVPVSEGDEVAAGAVLAQLDVSTLQNQADQAAAAVAAAEAQLEALASGTRPEEIAVDQSTVSAAQSGVVSATASLAAAEQSAYADADDAVRNQTDNLFESPSTNNPIFLVTTSDSQLQINIQSARVGLESVLDQWYGAMQSSTSSVTSLSALSDQDLKLVSSYLDMLALAVNGATPGAGVSASSLSAYKTDVAVARSEVTGVITSLTTAENAVATAQASVSVDEDQLTLAQASATPQEIDAQEAAVASAKAAEGSAQVALDHATLVAPFSGTVTDLAAKVGAVASPGVPELSLTNNSGLKIVVSVSEADAANIKPGDQANVTLDAFGTDTVFPATVTTIDGAPSTINGVQAYGVTLHFSQADDRVKSGMTAHADIVTAEDKDVLEVPSSLVINDNGDYFVLVKNGSAIERRPVQIGLMGDNGMTEIVSGVSQGENLASF